MKDLDGGLGITDIDRVLYILIGHRVVMAADFDVVVDVDFGFFPVRQHVRFFG